MMNTPASRGSRRRPIVVVVTLAVISAVTTIAVALINSRSASTADGVSAIAPKGTPSTPTAPRSGQDARPRFPFELEQEYQPSGWVGDGEDGERYVTIQHLRDDVQGVRKIVVKASYRPGPLGWAGVYWQHPPNNWRDKPGLNLGGGREISFLARGERGGEIVRFTSGGIHGGALPDRFEAGLPRQVLTTEWRPFRIDLSRENLSNVVGGFAWIAESSDNQGEPITFYLADLLVK